MLGPFEEEEEGPSAASDVVKVQGEDPATPGSEGDRLMFHAGDSESWVRDPLARPNETPGSYIDSPISGHKTKKHKHTSPMMCVCSISLLLDYMYMRVPSSPRSMAGVPSSQALPYYCTPPVTAPAVIGVRTVWRRKKPKENKKSSTFYLLLPKSVRLWGVHRHRTAWHLVGRTLRLTLQTV